MEANESRDYCYYSSEEKDKQIEGFNQEISGLQKERDRQLICSYCKPALDYLLVLLQQTEIENYETLCSYSKRFLKNISVGQGNPRFFGVRIAIVVNPESILRPITRVKSRPSCADGPHIAALYRMAIATPKVNRS